MTAPWLRRSNGAGAPLDNKRFSRSGGAIAAGLLAGAGLVVAAPATLAPATAAAGLLAWPSFRKAQAAGRWVFLWLCLGLLLYCGLTLMWAPSGSARSYGWTVLVALCLFAYVIASDLSRVADRELASRAALGGFAAGVALLFMDSLFGLSVSMSLLDLDSPEGVQEARQHARYALAAATLLLCGAGAVLCRGGPSGWLLTAAAAAFCFWIARQLDHGVAVVALSVGALAGAAAFLRPEATLLTLSQAAAVWLVASPWLLGPVSEALAQLSLPLLPPTHDFAWLGRLQTWSFTVERVSERPFLGWGFGASASFQDSYQLGGYLLPFVPSTPQSAALQLWLEAGAIGAAMAAAALAALGRRLGAMLARDRWGAAWAGAAFGVALTYFSLDLGLWSAWFWGALVMAASVLRLSRPPE